MSGLFNMKTKEVSVYHIRVIKEAMGLGGHIILIVRGNQVVEWLEEKGKKNRLVSTGTLLSLAHSTNWL